MNEGFAYLSVNLATGKVIGFVPQIEIHHADGSMSYFRATANSNSSRGSLLMSVIAASASGDTITAHAGTYATTGNLWKAGVNLVFELGAVVTWSNPANGSVMFDDGGVAGTCKVTGRGTFAMTSATIAGAWNVYGMKVSNASSVAVFEADSFIQSSSNSNTSTSGGLVGVFGGDVYTRIRHGVGYHYGYYWENGRYTAEGDYIAAPGGAIGSNVSATPTGDFFVNVSEIVGTTRLQASGACIYMQSTQALAATWVRTSIVRLLSMDGIQNAIENNGGKLYVTAQKIFGGFWACKTNASFAPALSYITADKMEAVDAQGDEGRLVVVGEIGSNSSYSRLEIKEYNPNGLSGIQLLSVAGSGHTVDFIGGKFVGNSDSVGIVMDGPGIANAHNLVLDTSANASNDAVLVDDGGINLHGCIITSNAAKKDVNRTSGTANIINGRGTNTNGTFTTSGTVNNIGQ